MAKILIFLIICFFVLFSCIPSGVQNTNNPDVTNEEDSEEEEELFNDTATEILLNSDILHLIQNVLSEFPFEQLNKNQEISEQSYL